MSNMELWDALKTPPQTALKTIAFGPLKGKSDISPQWRYQAMTEHFGPCGIGWKWEIVEKWTEDAPSDTRNGLRAVFVRVHLFFAIHEGWSAPIEGLGGSMLIEIDKNGTRINDEAYKMATTDAIGCALKMIGVAADVYLGNMEGSKYAPKQQPQQQPANPHDAYKDKATAIIAKHHEAIAKNPQLKEWIDVCAVDEFWRDIYKNLVKQFGG